MSIEQELRAHHLEKYEDREIPPVCYVGDDFWQATQEELNVFDLREDEIGALLAAWEMYMAIVGIDHNDFYGTDLCNRALPALPYLEKGTQDVEQWTTFAALFGIKARKAYGWYWKDFFWHSRDGVRVWPDEAGALD